MNEKPSAVFPSDRMQVSSGPHLRVAIRFSVASDASPLIERFSNSTSTALSCKANYPVEVEINSVSRH